MAGWSLKDEVQRIGEEPAMFWSGISPYLPEDLEKPPVAQLLKNFPTVYGTRKFVTVLTRALYCSLS
jgi:hypothetical protein